MIGPRVQSALSLFVLMQVFAGNSVLAQERSEPVKVVQGTETGVRMEILSLKRGEGGMLTLRVAFVNESGGQIKNSALPGKGNVENFSLLDYGNRRRYPVIRDSGGGCLCTSLNPFNTTDPGRHVLWAKFPAPPESVQQLTLLMPEAEPLDDVPVSH